MQKYLTPRRVLWLVVLVLALYLLLTALRRGE